MFLFKPKINEFSGTFGTQIFNNYLNCFKQVLLTILFKGNNAIYTLPVIVYNVPQFFSQKLRDKHQNNELGMKKLVENKHLLRRYPRKTIFLLSITFIWHRNGRLVYFYLFRLLVFIVLFCKQLFAITFKMCLLK